MALRPVFDGDHNGVYLLGPRLRDVEGQAERHGWRYVQLDTTDVKDRDGFMAAAADAFDLPPDSLTAWDVLDYSLRGLDLEQPNGVLVVWTGWGGFAESDPDAFETALEVFHDACVAWGDDDVGGAVLLHGEGPETDLPQL